MLHLKTINYKHMQKYIAILRGINVGGKRKILMADLKTIFSKLEFTNIETYIQSGNVIFISKKDASNINLSNKIERAISENYNFEVPVIVMSVTELNEAISKNPFFEKNELDIERLHLTFLKAMPETNILEKIKTYDSSPDKFKIINKNVFVYCSGKYSNSKLTNKFFETKLKVSATTRNWKTVLKLSELSNPE